MHLNCLVTKAKQKTLFTEFVFNSRLHSKDVWNFNDIPCIFTKVQMHGIETSKNKNTNCWQADRNIEAIKPFQQSGKSI